MENGVFRIKDEMYSSGEKARDARANGGLREIVEEVVGREKLQEAAGVGEPPLDDMTLGGIGDLLQDEDSVDLSKVVSQEKEVAREEALTQDHEKKNPLRLKRNGLDYDEFLASYPRSFSNTTQMKSLVEMSRRVSAVSAGLFVKKTGGYVPDLTIGISEKSLPTIAFNTDEPFHTMLLAPRKAIVIDRNPSEIAISERQNRCRRPALHETDSLSSRDFQGPGSVPVPFVPRRN